MKTTATLSLSLFVLAVTAQSPGDTLTMYFDAPGEPLQLDSVYPAGCWQVGTPNKPVFTSAFSPGKALVTDTLLPHPANTTCYAEYTLLATDPNYLGRTIQFKFFRDMGPTAMGWVEVWDPWGQQWLSAWDAYYNNTDVTYTGQGPVFLGQDSVWQNAWIESPCLGVFWNEGEKAAKWYEPEMRLRFVFQSQDNPDSLDGWMIDNVRASVSLCTGSVDESSLSNVSLHPSPAVSSVTIEPRAGTRKPFTVSAFKSDGRVAFRAQPHAGLSAEIDVSAWANGIYMFRIEQAGEVISRRVAVQH